MKILLRKLPKCVKTPLHTIRKFFSYGNSRLCPLCNKSFRHFYTIGYIPRADAQCPHCYTFERHRFLWLFLQRKTDFFHNASRKMLHIAPESCFETRFHKLLGENYLTADLLNPHAMVKMDITDIQYEDEAFDIIYCSHVLEHVPDDRKAMREFFRVLKSDGWAILLVPITLGKTFEDPSIVTPEERLKAFGQDDHVRRYGFDYIDRLKDAGFKVEIFKVNDVATDQEAIKMGLTAACGEIFYCTKS